MEKKKPEQLPLEPAETAAENTNVTDEQAEPHSEEESSHGNYLFALKIICVLVVIILIIVILQASGVPIAIKDWFAHAADWIHTPLSFPNPFTSLN